MDTISGLHHVTAICSDAQKNLDFYTQVLGLRLVKLTVNFDDPFSYHLYYGDELGRPGTILTFFAWSGAKARAGNQSVAATALAVPVGALEWWKTYLAEKSISFTLPVTRFGENLLQFHDPDGLVLEIVESPRADTGFVWKNGSIEAKYAIRGLHSVTIAAEGYEFTANVLTRSLGIKGGAESPLEPNRFRFESGQGIGGIVDIVCLPDAPAARGGAGGVHHIAFRVADDGAQTRFRAELVRGNFNVSPIMDRNYFHSIYFREPGGVLFELATDNPGFAIDESAENLGKMLKLPTQLEAYRAQIEERAAKIVLPHQK
jgi:glyoxalase family protein